MRWLLKTRDSGQSDSTAQVILAMVPVGITYFGFLASWGWQVAKWPALIGLPGSYFLVLLILGTGTVWVVRRGILPWSYSWLAFGLYNVSPLIGGSIAELLLPPSGVISDQTIATIRLLSRISNHLVVFLALLGALFLVRRSRQDALFFFLLFLAARVVTYPVHLEDRFVLTPAVVTGVLSGVAAIQGVATATLIYRFLTGYLDAWLPIIALGIVVLLDPIAKLWPIILQDGDLATNVLGFGEEVGKATLLLAAFVVIAYLTARVYHARSSPRVVK